MDTLNDRETTYNRTADTKVFRDSIPQSAPSSNPSENTGAFGRDIVQIENKSVEGNDTPTGSLMIN